MENKINDAGLAIIRRYEGCKLTTYLDVVGVPSIGYGHTGPDVEEGQTITQEEANSLLAHDVARFETGVSELVEVELTSNQFSALVSLAYNIGLTNLGKSTLLQMVNERAWPEAVAQFLRWKHADHRVLPGLTARRATEAALFARAE